MQRNPLSPRKASHAKEMMSYTSSVRETHPDINELLEKVNMSSAFVNLAKDDAQIIEDMKQCMVHLNEEAKKRETLYTAVEHNTKYLCALAT